MLTYVSVVPLGGSVYPKKLAPKYKHVGLKKRSFMGDLTY